MEKKSLLQYFREEAGTYQRLAERTVKILAENRIYTIDLLMAKTSEEIWNIKGIGNMSMNLISKVMTKEQMVRAKSEDVYKKHCHECEPTCLHDWFQKAGSGFLESYRIEKIMKRNGIKSVDMFMHMTLKDYDQMNGIANKRLAIIDKTQKLIQQSNKTKNLSQK